MSQANLEALDQAGYTYIVGSRMNKIPYDIAKYQKTKKLSNNQIITSKTSIAGQRIIYQYRVKRAALDLLNIEKQIEKAKKIISGKVTAKKAKALVDIKGYVIKLLITEASDTQVIAYYHRLWYVEQSFRMSRSDLKARPIFHHLKDSIDAHLTVVMAALAIQKTIEQLASGARKKIVRELRSLRSGTVVITGNAYPAKAFISPETKPLLKKLRARH